jgi:RimJ/RimL family protein N-acetyltransferase
MTILKTQHLTLAPCRPEDAADFIDLERDPEVMRFLNGGPVDHEAIDPDAAFLMPRGTEPHVWTARHAVGGGFVGWFCLWPENATLAELGYRLRCHEWGHGFASEGARALVGWGFRSAGYDTIVATTMAVNQASRRVMEKLGMIHTRTDFTEWPSPIPGSEQGEVWYELTRAKWEGR